MWEDTTIKLERCHQGRFNVHVGVDEPGHGNAGPACDLACAAILAVGADDGGATDCDVGWDQCARDKIRGGRF